MNTAPATHPAFERHYTVVQLAKLWGFGETAIRALAANYPGVLKFNGNRASGKKCYIRMRIPESVAIRMHEQLTSQDVGAFRRRRNSTGATGSRKSSVAAAESRSL